MAKTEQDLKDLEKKVALLEAVEGDDPDPFATLKGHHEMIETHDARILELESGKEIARERLDRLEQKVTNLKMEEAKVEEMERASKVNKEIYDYVRRHEMDSEAVSDLTGTHKKIKRHIWELKKKLAGEIKEHELELFGVGGREAGHGLTSRIESAEKANKSLSRQVWWIRKGVLILLLVLLYSLIW